jgi:uncharacterized protein YhaN
LRIAGWHIYGYGIFADWIQKDLSSGLNVLLGPNEAGKSTLLAFLRGMLFGFPDKRSRTNRYQPIYSARHGGRLDLAGSDGVYMVERLVGKRKGFSVVLPDRSNGTVDAIKQLTGGIDQKLFQNVFAFGLDELQQIETLTADQVRDQIFSAGVGGVTTSVSQVKAVLKKEQELLLKIRGKALINDLVGRLKQNSQEFEEARLRAESYQPLILREAELEDQVKAYKNRLNELRQGQRRFQLLIDLWPAAKQLISAQEERSQIQVIEEFPLDGLARLEKLQTRLADAKDNLRQRHEEHQQTNLEIEALPKNDAILQFEKPLQRALRTQASIDNSRVLIEKHSRQLDELVNRRQVLHARLGQDLDPGRLDTSIEVEDKIRKARIQLERMTSLEPANGELPGWMSGLGVVVSFIIGSLAAWRITSQDLSSGSILSALFLLLVVGTLIVYLNGRSKRLRTRKAEQDRKAAEDDWIQLLHQFDYPDSLSFENIGDFLSALREFQDLERRIAALEGDRQKLKRDVGEAEQAALDLLRQTGRAESEGSLEERLSFLEADIIEAVDAARKAEILNKRILEQAPTLEVVKKRVEDLESQIEDLLQVGKGFDPESFRKQALKQQRAIELDGLIRKLQSQLDQGLGQGSAAEELSAKLNLGEVDKWHAEKSRIEQEIKEFEVKLIDITKEQGRVSEEKRTLEQESNMWELGSTAEAMQKELAEAVERYRVVTASLALLQDTLSEYQKHRQPAVLKTASEIFEKVTDSHFQQVFQPADQESEIKVIDREGKIFDVDQLSRGTVEQLYIAIRLGVAKEFTRRVAPLPLVMDDVMVNFDPERQEKMAEVFAELAGEVQILYFTCHPQAVELLNRAGAKGKMISFPAVS